MSEEALIGQLSELESLRTKFGGKEAAKVVRLLKSLDRARISDAASLIRFHETLLFLRAFPQEPEVVRLTERILNHFHEKIRALRDGGADMDEFDTFETSGIAGTAMEDTLSFDVASWMVERMPRQVKIAWENYEPGRELGTTGPRFMPLLADDAWVEADTPWRKWVETVSGKDGGDVRWLVERFARLEMTETEKAELYESLRVPLRWELENSKITRTRNWQRPRKVFYHSTPLINRSEVSLAEELAKRPPRMERLSRKAGERVIELIREVMLVRYRELYGTTLGDPASVRRADLGSDERGRGVVIYLWNLPPDRRLPLRAYVAGLTLKNGVPINYIEAIGLCEWMEVGFNTFYTFRGGEAGWVYAQVLRCLCALMGTKCVSVYPYQLGHDNDEAIESGAFWFYRKLGFRPGKPELLELAQAEERKIAADGKYRTSARTLKRLAAGHVFYELPGAELSVAKIGAWDQFSTRNIGLRVNERMAREFEGDAEKMRKHCRRELERALRVKTDSWPKPQKKAFDDFALLFSSVARKWTRAEKAGLLEIIQAKSDTNEMEYLRLTQRHLGVRNAFLKLGS
jgi:hypothetical protein